jgi:hypothetical protein
MEEMAATMAAYLDSDVVDWTIPHANMPRLTIGGYLMRQKRLTLLRDLLSEEEQLRLVEAIDQFNATLKERVVRFEKRAHQELHIRIAEWIGFLRDLSRRARTEVNYYSGAADTRIVIHELVNKLQTPPYELEPGVLDEIEAIDKLLRTRLSDHAFIWDAIWEPAYPREDYWWMYGCPQQ